MSEETTTNTKQELATSIVANNKNNTASLQLHLLSKRAKKGEIPETYYGIKLEENEITLDNLNRIVNIFGIDFVLSKLVMQTNLELQKLWDKTSKDVSKLLQRITEQDFHDRKSGATNALTQFQALSKRLQAGEPLAPAEQTRMRELAIEMQTMLAASQELLDKKAAEA